MLLSGCGSEKVKPAEPKGKSYFAYFDTISYIYSYAGDSDKEFEKNCETAVAVLSRYNTLFDIYHEYSGVNNLCTLNKSAGGEPVVLEDELLDFLEFAVDVCGRTDGAVNPMLGSVLQLWHQCRTEAEADPTDARIPEYSELKDAAEHTDISLLEIDRENHTARISDGRASIDVGAIGKGYATEKAAEALEAAGVNSYVLNIGGNIRIIGTRPDGSGWTTGVKDPKNPDGGISAKIRISDTSCVTSGIYERYFVVDGEKYHHIIDKDTLYPSKYFSSVTVVTKDSGLADALSTALFCMDCSRGKELLAQFPDAEALWIYADGTSEYTAGFQKLEEAAE